MVFIVIGDSDSKKNTGSPSGLASLKKAIHENKHVFLMIFSNGCPPCEATKPIWDRLKSTFAHDKNTVVARIVSSDFKQLQNAGSEPNGVPTFRYLHNKKVEEFSEGRLFNVFTNWIHSKCKTKKGGRTVKMRAKRGGGNDSTVIGRIVELTKLFIDETNHAASYPPDKSSEITQQLIANLRSISKEAEKLGTSLFQRFKINETRFTSEAKLELVNLYDTLPASCKTFDDTTCDIIDVYKAYAEVFRIVGPVYLLIVKEKQKDEKKVAFPTLDYNLKNDFFTTNKNLEGFGYVVNRQEQPYSGINEKATPDFTEFIKQFERMMNATNNGVNMDEIDKFEENFEGDLSKIIAFFNRYGSPNLQQIGVSIDDETMDSVYYNETARTPQEKFKSILQILHKSFEDYNQTSYWDEVNHELKARFIETANNASRSSGGKRRKWSLKYKQSINCKRPKGFSQKQYCKRKEKKTKRRRV
jgi:hypothetical protein